MTVNNPNTPNLPKSSLSNPDLNNTNKPHDNYNARRSVVFAPGSNIGHEHTTTTTNADTIDERRNSVIALSTTTPSQPRPQSIIRPVSQIFPHNDVSFKVASGENNNNSNNTNALNTPSNNNLQVPVPKAPGSPSKYQAPPKNLPSGHPGLPTHLDMNYFQSAAKKVPRGRKSTSILGGGSMGMSGRRSILTYRSGANSVWTGLSTVRRNDLSRMGPLKIGFLVVNGIYTFVSMALVFLVILTWSNFYFMAPIIPIVSRPVAIMVTVTVLIFLWVGVTGFVGSLSHSKLIMTIAVMSAVAGFALCITSGYTSYKHANDPKLDVKIYNQWDRLTPQQRATVQSRFQCCGFLSSGDRQTPDGVMCNVTRPGTLDPNQPLIPGLGTVSVVAPSAPSASRDLGIDEAGVVGRFRIDNGRGLSPQVGLEDLMNSPEGFNGLERRQNEITPAPSPTVSAGAGGDAANGDGGDAGASGGGGGGITDSPTAGPTAAPAGTDISFTGEFVDTASHSGKGGAKKTKIKISTSKAAPVAPSVGRPTPTTDPQIKTGPIVTGCADAYTDYAKQSMTAVYIGAFSLLPVAVAQFIMGVLATNHIYD
ncbi:hypothetical protein HDU76_006878 [Blyttiomyces sp. JEL0837]|nr:hypothetical protein HDU76_006878 [Blyttiomyces sp. JEL0837]